MSEWNGYFIPADQAVLGATMGGANDSEAGGGANQTTNITPNVGNQQGFLQQVMAMGAPQGTTVQWKVGPDGGFVLQAFDPSGQPIPGLQQTIAADSSPNFIRDGALLIAGGYLGGSALAAGAGGSGAIGGAGEYGATAGGAAAGGGDGAVAAGGLVGGGDGGLTTAESLYGNAGYGAGMSGAETGAYDAGMAAGSGGGTAGASGSWVPGLTNGQTVGAGLNLLGAAYGANASRNAANAQQQAGQASNELQRYMYDTTRADYAPYRAAGTSALAQIQNLLSNPNAITQQPDYQFGLDQGNRSLNNGAASRGMTYSGAQGKALQRYGQDYAGTKLNESYNRLASIAGIGQQATGSTAAAGQNYANTAGNTLQDIGNARAGSYVGSANAWGNAAQNIGNGLQQQYLWDTYYGKKP